MMAVLIDSDINESSGESSGDNESDGKNEVEMECYKPTGRHIGSASGGARENWRLPPEVMGGGARSTSSHDDSTSSHDAPVPLERCDANPGLFEGETGA